MPSPLPPPLPVPEEPPLLELPEPPPLPSVPAPTQMSTFEQLPAGGSPSPA
ncbi:hypothetical protein AB0I98_27730 [Streptomyces sp. NPDC050211]|uniref:hypothetical protein n=1 Tax=Streptomyces sp. NPDC050211 TaxID=3154932 RepID=UPI0034203DE4